MKLEAGNGGDGAMSFRHEKFRPKGGPDGGDGGHGANITLKASRNQNTLAAFRYQKLLKAEDGQSGGQNNRHGKSGEGLEVMVPIGTAVSDENGTVLADLTADGQEVVIARGGKGGYGNAHFISSTRQAPRVSEKGEKGEQQDVIFELKMIADVGIVGLPNAGKSTLLSVISNAKPEIANYPFTTLQPNLGVVDIDSENSLLFADIPGLIEGASQGKGLGDEFLRHVERTSVLIHLIDVYSEDIAEAYKTIMAELAAYQTNLSKKPQIVVLSKAEGLDKEQIEEGIAQLKKLVPRGTPVMAISSPSGVGIKELLRAAQQKAGRARAASAKNAEKAPLPVIGFKENENDWQVKKQAKKFIVTGKKIERFAARTKFGDSFGEYRLRDIMAKMGILAELERQGIEAGQVIQVGGPSLGELEY